MASETTTSGTSQAIIDAYARAHDRALEHKLVAYKNADGSFDVPSSSTPGEVHTVAIVGARWYDMVCTCKGAGHLSCMHRAVVVHARKYRFHAVRPEASAKSRNDAAEVALRGAAGDMDPNNEHDAQLVQRVNAAARAAHRFEGASTRLALKSDPFAGAFV